MIIYGGVIMSRGITVSPEGFIVVPTQIPNLEVWYNASTGTSFNKTTSIASGTSITSWQNAGGLSSHDWNSTGGNRPVWFSNVQNSLGVTRFNPTGLTSQCLTINPVTYIQSLSGATLSIVFKSSSTAAGIRYASSTDVGGFQWGQNGTQWIGGFAGATFIVSGVTADTNWHQVTIKFDGSLSGNANRLKVYIDGVQATLTFTGTVNTITSASASYYYGGCTGTSSTNTSNFWIGDIGELLIWTRALTDTEVTSVKTYTSNKWSI